MMPDVNPLHPAAKLTSEAKNLATEATILTDKATMLADKVAPPVPVTSGQGHVLPPKTTEEDDRAAYGQRRINLIWEATQMLIAVSVIWASITVSSYLAVQGQTDAQVAAFVFLYGVANLVTGFYFGRTNHTRVGGISSRDSREER